MNERIASDAPGKATLLDWLAVVAGTLGALMALIDVSIVNAALPTIQGEFGATPSEVTWVSTAYLVAEIVVIPLVAWLERILGLRRLLLSASVLFTSFSIVCGLSESLEILILGRVGQGLAGGILIPTALTIVARRLPPHQQPLGLALTAMTALVGPAVGPLLGGYITENISWNYAFFMNAPICALQAGIILIVIERSRCNFTELNHADWMGILGLVLGLGSGTTLLEQGHKRQWFESISIWWMTIAVMIGIILVTIGQLRAPRPVIRLSLIRNREVLIPVILMTTLGALLYSCLFLTPQFLSSISKYNALQAGEVAFLGGISAVPTALCFPFLAKKIDSRLIVAIGFSLIAGAVFRGSTMTTESVGADFAPSLLLFGVGTTLSSIPLQQAVIAAVSAQEAAEANSLLSAFRNLGGSISLAIIASGQEARLDFHYSQISASISASDPYVQQWLSEIGSAMGDGAGANEAALNMMVAEIINQATVMAFNDMFLYLSIISLISIPISCFLRVSRIRRIRDLGS